MPIDDPIIHQFKSNLKILKLKPDICNGLDRCKIYGSPKGHAADIMVNGINTELQSKKSQNNLIQNNITEKFNPNHPKNEIHGTKKSLNKVSALKNTINKNVTKNRLILLMKTKER